jgi:hypothetical protein
MATLELVRTRENGLCMSATLLGAMRAKLSVIRELCPPMAEGLGEHLSAFDKACVCSALGLLEHMLLSLTEGERSLLKDEAGRYRDVSEEDLHGFVQIAAGLDRFMGVECPLILDVHNVLYPRDDGSMSLARQEAGLAFDRRLAELCGFGLELESRRRRRLSVVHSK